MLLMTPCFFRFRIACDFFFCDRFIPALPQRLHHQLRKQDVRERRSEKGRYPDVFLL